MILAVTIFINKVNLSYGSDFSFWGEYNLRGLTGSVIIPKMAAVLGYC